MVASTLCNLASCLRSQAGTILVLYCGGGGGGGGLWLSG